MNKVIVADRIAPAGVDYLKEQDGIEVVEAYGSSPEEILQLVSDVSAIIVRSETRVDSSVFAAAPKLRVVGRAGVGIDNIDLDSATEHGVVVMNTPGGNTIATAELTFTHLLCSARPVPQAHSAVMAGKWNRKDFAGTELHEKALGVLGLGRVGTEVARRAKAFGMTILAYDPFLTTERASDLEVESVDLAELFKRADFITVHMPLTDDTRGMIDADAIATMKDEVRILNVARGGIVDEAALADALRSGKVASAGIDVFASEPLPEDSPLRSAPNIVLTPHLGASTLEAQESVGIEIASAITELLAGGMVRNAINMPSVDPHTLQVLKPYLRLGQHLGSIVQQITPARVQSLRISYWGKITDIDTLPLTRSIQRGFLLRISGENVNDVNAPMLMKRLGVQVETVSSGADSDYTELVRVEAIDSDGGTTSVDGTLIGVKHQPRLVQVNGREVEAELQGTLLMLENRDVIGIVGMLGTVLSRHGVNIANMSLSRNAVGGVALTVLQLDTNPPQACLDEIQQQEDIANVFVVRLTG